MSIWDFLVSLDIKANEVMGGNKGETISSRLGRYIKDDSRKLRAWASRLFCRTVLLPLGILLDRSFTHCVDNIQDEHRK